MNYLIYPTKVMNITQTYLSNSSHYNNYHGFPKDYPIDEACENSGRSYFYCPCDEMIVKRIYGVGTTGTNTFWLESTSKVITPTFEDFVTILVMHPNDDTLSTIKEGQIFKRYEPICLEGNDGNATGYHFHISVAKGKFVYPGWEKNSVGNWVINTKAQKPENCFYIDTNFTNIVNARSLKFVNLPLQKIISPRSKDISKRQIEVFIENLRVRNAPNGNILGYAVPGIYNIISTVNKDNYDWYQVENGKWIAYDATWATVYEPLSTPKEIYTFVYKAKSTGDYVIKLYQDEELYIKNKQEGA